MILAGDIGGTKTNLALFDWTTERVEPVREQTFASADYKSLEEVVTEFLKPPAKEPSEPAGEEEAEPAAPQERPLSGPVIDAACFGVAGPVIDNRCQATNLPWVIDGADLAKHVKAPHASLVRLLNDLEATAYGLLVLRPDETTALNQGSPSPASAAAKRTMALIAAGTGLGEAILFWQGSRYHPCPLREATPVLRRPATLRSTCCATSEPNTST